MIYMFLGNHWGYVTYSTCLHVIHITWYWEKDSLNTWFMFLIGYSCGYNIFAHLFTYVFYWLYLNTTKFMLVGEYFDLYPIPHDCWRIIFIPIWRTKQDYLDFILHIEVPVLYQLYLAWSTSKCISWRSNIDQLSDIWTNFLLSQPRLRFSFEHYPRK